MDTLPMFRRLFEYDAWANERVRTTLAPVDERAERARHLFGHLLAAQRIWLARLEQEEGLPIAVWPELSLGECHTLAEGMAHRWREYLGGLGPAGLETAITYRTTRGELFEHTVRQILTHVINHSAYHRGQIAVALREADATPPVTDFIAFEREAT